MREVKHWHKALWILAIMIASTAVIPWLGFGNARPELALVVTVCFALYYGPGMGLLFGCLLGLTQDLWLGQYLGLFFLADGLMGALFGLLADRFYSSDLPMMVLAAALATAFHDLVVMGLLELAGLQVAVLPFLQHITLTTAIYDALLMAGVRWLVLRLYQRPGSQAAPGGLYYG